MTADHDTFKTSHSDDADNWDSKSMGNSRNYLAVDIWYSAIIDKLIFCYDTYIMHRILGLQELCWWKDWGLRSQIRIFQDVTYSQS